MSAAQTPEHPVVGISAGRLRGRRTGSLCVFQGIPFAVPPVGARRFLPPARVAPWTGVRDALAPGPAPPQVVDPLSELLGLDFEVPIAEDCLTLNVSTPGLDGGRRPVMLWLHGGAFARGSGASPAYDGQRLCERSDVVVATLNYRVGALGFTHLAPLLADSTALERGAGANLGLQDQIAALRWLRAEIGRFGGDPTRITVFGESAGAGSLVALLAMPEASGLFQRAIIQSAAPEGVLSEAEGLARAQQLLEQLGLPTEPAKLELGAVQALTPERILEAQQACIAAGPHRTGMFFAPVIDGTSLPKPPLAAIAEGCAADVEVLIGTTRQEMQLYSTIPGLGEFDDPVLQQIVASRVAGDVTPDARRQHVAAKAIRVYREELGRRGSTPSQQELFFALESDLSLRLPAIRLAEGQARHQPHTFMYLFTWKSPLANGHGGTLGSCHALDVSFTFGALDSARAMAFTGGDSGAGAAARDLSDRLMDAWLAFAGDGDPNHPGLDEWPTYTSERRSTMLLGEKCGRVDAPMESERAVWEEAP